MLLSCVFPFYILLIVIDFAFSSLTASLTWSSLCLFSFDSMNSFNLEPVINVSLTVKPSSTILAWYSLSPSGIRLNIAFLILYPFVFLLSN